MTELRKAAQMALEALDSDHPDIQLRAAISLRAALAQPEQEPVLHKWAALFEDPNNDWQAGYEHARRWVFEVGLQSIAAPPQRKPLTDDQIAQIDWKDGETLHDFARAIERAHGIE